MHSMMQDNSRAQSWSAADTKKNDFKLAKRGLWITYAYGFEQIEKTVLQEYAQLVLHAQVLRKDVVTDSSITSGKYERNLSIAGLEIRFGQPDFNAILGGRAERASSDAKGHVSARTLSLRVERRVLKDFWLNFSLEGKGTRSSTDNKPFAFASIKWGSSSGATLAP